MLEPLSPLWMIGLEVVKEGEEFSNCNFDENDLITILIDNLEDALLEKWIGNEPFNPSIFTDLCVLLSDVEWYVILSELIPQWQYHLDRQKEYIAQERLLTLFADACEF